MHPDELTLPLWRVLGRAVVRILTFAGDTERWSHLTAAERAERRARWPAWRRAVRPIGLGVVWLGTFWSLVLGTPPTAIRFAGVLLMTPIAALSIRDWWSDVPSGRKVGGARSGNPRLPGGATEHPTP